MNLNATCALGMESLVSQELRQLGFEVRADNGNVRFTGDEMAICRSNLWLRTADRVWLELGSFTATTFEELFEGTRGLNWADWIPQDAEFPVEGASFESQLSSVPACQSITKKAVVESLKQRYKVSWFEEKGALYRIKVTLVRNRVTLSLDTSGTGLHRRGYRTLTGEAPLRETLAAGLVLLSDWTPDRPFIDPLCGSGTIPLEAALIGLKRAPGLLRDFASERWPTVGPGRWASARAEAEAAFDRTTRLKIQGFDRDGRALKQARVHLKQSGLEERGVSFETRDLQELRTSRRHGVLITNPPYGERLGEKREAEALYGVLGEVTAPLEGWSIYVLTSHPHFPRHFGRRAPRVRKLYNGSIPCSYYQWPFPGIPGARG